MTILYTQQHFVYPAPMALTLLTTVLLSPPRFYVFFWPTCIFLLYVCMCVSVCVCVCMCVCVCVCVCFGASSVLILHKSFSFFFSLSLSLSLSLIPSLSRSHAHELPLSLSGGAFCRVCPEVSKCVLNVFSLSLLFSLRECILPRMSSSLHRRGGRRQVLHHRGVSKDTKETYQSEKET